MFLKQVHNQKDNIKSHFYKLLIPRYIKMENIYI